MLARGVHCCDHAGWWPLPESWFLVAGAAGSFQLVTGTAGLGWLLAGTAGVV